MRTLAQGTIGATRSHVSPGKAILSTDPTGRYCARFGWSPGRLNAPQPGQHEKQLRAARSPGKPAARIPILTLWAPLGAQRSSVLRARPSPAAADWSHLLVFILTSLKITWAPQLSRSISPSPSLSLSVWLSHAGLSMRHWACGRN